MLDSCLGSNASSGCKLLIWDVEGSPLVGDWTTVLWSDYAKASESNIVSIPAMVEEQADVLRARYLAWIYELGETRIKGKRVIDHLELRPGFSYWWMTLLAQKFNISGTSEVDNVIKAFALENIVSERKPTSILLISNNDKIALTLQGFCQKLRLDFKWDCAKQPAKPRSITRLIYDFLPYPIRALITLLLYFFRSIPLLCTKQVSTNLNGEISFVDVLVHLDKKAFTTGNFISNYWTTLVDTLSRSNVKTNWFHNYYYQETHPTPVSAQELCGRFSKYSSEIQSHTLIEANLRPVIFIKALKDYLRKNIVSFHLSTVNQYFIPTGSTLDLWPLFQHDWADSLRGPCAIIHCLYISLYEEAFSRIPFQRLGVYIQENQPWEMALIYAWKAAGHGKLIGVPHTTVRFWDLRYFYDSRSYERIGMNPLPIPDVVAVNGPVAKKTYLEGGYPESQIKEVEALRFTHLLNPITANVPKTSSRNTLNVLVCGDFLSSTNDKMLSWLVIAARSLSSEMRYILKPHPAYPVKLNNFPSLALEITDAPFAELFVDCDVVFTSNITSVAVDAYCSGMPVIQMLDGNTFNMSPLRGLRGGVYVRNPMELTEALRNTHHREHVAAETYFCLDEELPRWKKLLGLSAGDAADGAGALRI